MSLDELNADYHGRRGWKSVYWLGTRMVKCPLDAWIMQEIIVETRPDLIIETGTHSGGSALFFASICELLGHGAVVSIDIQEPKPDYPRHPRLKYLSGLSSIDPVVKAEVIRLAGGGYGVPAAMVVLDSDHSQAHVAAEMEAYWPLVGVGCYMIVEDTNFGAVYPELLPGPAEAVAAFLERHAEFEIDRSREKHGITFNPGGYLRRKV
jgi:cephalosporin hydroxylase